MDSAEVEQAMQAMVDERLAPIEHGYAAFQQEIALAEVRRYAPSPFIGRNPHG
jgi:hypothetical protein